VRFERLPVCGAVFGRAVPDVLTRLGAFVFRDSEVKEDAPLDCFTLKPKTMRSIATPARTQRHLQADLQLQERVVYYYYYYYYYYCWGPG